MKITVPLFTVALVLSTSLGFGQPGGVIGFDLTHGQQPKIVNGWNTYLLRDATVQVEAHEGTIGENILQSYRGFVIFSPTRAFEDAETRALVAYVKNGGALLLIFDEERRTPISVGVNNLIEPFGMRLTDDIPAKHNCGAIADDGVVCKSNRELPFSGGRSVEGGTVVSRVYDDGGYVHCAFTRTGKGGKLIVMSDGMAGLLLGSADGERLSGTTPADTKYWGKDSEIFMQEILSFLIAD